MGDTSLLEEAWVTLLLLGGRMGDTSLSEKEWATLLYWKKGQVALLCWRKDG